MRIALISYWTCPLERLGVLAAGGMNVYVYYLAIYLGKLGHKVDIYTRVHRSQHRREVDLNKDIKIIHLEVDNTANSFLFFSSRIFDKVKKENIHYDIIHCHYYLSGLIGLELKNQLNIPFVITFHTLELMKEKYFGQMNPERVEKERNLVRLADGIIASTEIEKSDLITNYQADSGKIFVIPPGVNHHIFKSHDKLFSRKKLGLPLNKKIILFVGRIDPIKGLKFLISAIHRLTVEDHTFMNKFRVLLIGGDINSRHFWSNPEVKKIKKMIVNKKLDCCIKFLGSKPHNLLPFYYSASDVVVMPSVYESFGLVVLEALSCGSTILASRVGGLKSLVRDGVNGKLFESGNIKSLGKELNYLLKQRSKDKINMQLKAMSTSQEYCWDKQARKIIDVYNRFL